jgi:uncharacterized protein
VTGRWVAAYARAVTRRPGMALAATVAATLVLGVAAAGVRLDNNFAALFASSSAEALAREEYRAAFGPDDGLLAVALTFDGATAAADPDGRDRVAVVDTVSRAVGEVDGVARVDSPTVTDVLALGTGRPTPAFGTDSTLATMPFGDRAALARGSGLGTQFLLSGDARTWLVVGELAADRDSYEEVVGPAGEFRTAVRNALRDRGVEVDAAFAGVAFTRVAAIEQMQSDLLALSPLATVVMAVLLALFFRRAVAVLAPLVAIGLSVVATAGVVGLAGDDLNQVTVIYPILLMGIVVASATHLIHRYYRERAAGRDPAESGRITIERVLPGALVANLTSAIGFASLATAHMRILREFGLYLAAGVMLAWAIGITVVPAVLVLRRAEAPARYRRAAVAPGRDGRLAGAVTGRRAAPALVAAGLAVVAGSAALATTATYDYALTDMLPAGDPTTVGNRRIDRELAGVIPIEVSLRGPAGAFDDPAVLARARDLDAYLGGELGTRPSGVTALVADLERAGVAGAAADLAATWRAAEAARPGALDRLLAPDHGHARLAGFAPDRGGRWVVALRDRVEATGARLFAGTGVEVRVTGEAPVAYDGMNTLTRELVVSTIVALVFIVAAVGLVFRSPGLALVAALPNVAPVVAGMGLYALSSDTLDPLPGLVFCIAAGLAADDTVHLINRWRELRSVEPGLDGPSAVVTALVTARTAMVSSTLVLVAGFGCLALSGFGWNRELGLLGGLVLLLALVSDLVLGSAGLSLYGRWDDRRRAARAARARRRADCGAWPAPSTGPPRSTVPN